MKAKLLLLCIIAVACIAAHYPGGEVVVQISMDNAVDVKGVELTLCDIPDYLTLSQAEATTRTLGFMVEANDISGCVKVVILDMGGDVISAGVGAIVTLRFNIALEALPGDVAMSLSEYLVVGTDNKPLPVVPIDGTLIIVPTPTPTPTPSPTPVPPVELWVHVLEI